MKKRNAIVIFLLIFSVIFLTFHCKPKNSNQGAQKPNPPVMVPKSPETAIEEKGIDAVPEVNAIFVEWFSTKDETVRRWKLFRAASGQGFKLIAVLASSDTSYLDKNLETGRRYSYFLTAVNASGLESAPSDTVSYKLLPKPVNLGNTLDAKPEFEWQFVSVPPVLYVLRLFENPSQNLIWLSEVAPSYGASEHVHFNWDHTATVDSLERGVSYYWRVDEIGSEFHSGSESDWKIFTRP